VGFLFPTDKTMRQILKFGVVIGVTVLAFVSAACASAGGGHADGCAVAGADTVFQRRGPVYRDCAVDRKAELTTPSIRPDFRPSRGNACYSGEVEFVVDSTGHPEPETAHLVRSNDANYGQALLDIVPQLRFSPAVRQSSHVRQIYSLRMAAQAATVAVPMGSPSRPAPPSAPTC
jgi:hypothetical protein